MDSHHRFLASIHRRRQPRVMASVLCCYCSVMVSPAFFQVLVAVLFSSRLTSSSMASTNNNNNNEVAAALDLDTEWGRAIQQEGVPAPDSVEFCSSSALEEQVDVAIVGGGLVGLAVAIGLTRNGIHAKVYERAPQLRSVSQGILCIQPNGMSALETIHPDIPRLVTSLGCQRRTRVHTRLHANNGTVTTESTVTNVGEEALSKYGRIKVGLTWHNMQKVLASLLPPEVVVTNRSLSSFVENDDSVLLYFQQEDNNEQVPLVVRAKAGLGCDGMFSRTRRQLFPEDRPIYFGQLNWGTVIDTDKLPPGMHPPNAVRCFAYDGEPRWMSMFNDGGDGQTFWQFRVSDPEKAMALSGSKGRGGLGLKGVKDALLPVAKPSPDVYKAIKRIPEGQIFERSILGRSPLPTWRSPGGRVALVGDAAHGMHPNVSQGANTAFATAAAVVKAMVAHKNRGDWIMAFKEYEQVRKPCADIIQTFANMMGITESTGKQFLQKDVVQDALDWIMRGSPVNHAPKELVELPRTFDPCAEPGVSLL